MFRTVITQFLLRRTSIYFRLPFQYANFANNEATVVRKKWATDQMEYIKFTTENNVDDWETFRTTILSKEGSINEKNVDGVLLKVLINHKKLDIALSYADYLKNTGGELSLGIINGLLNLYYQIGLEKPLTDKQKEFILDSYKHLYDEYKVLDTTTCERLLHALCIIGEWKKACKVLDDIYMSGTATHSAFSTLIATLLKADKYNEALKFIERSISNQRKLLPVAYEAWIDYILRKYKIKDTRVKYLEEICKHISKNCSVISEKTAEKLKEIFASLGWNARTTGIKKSNGQCAYCRSTLDCLKLSEDEFKLLQENVKEKLIVRSDLLLSSSEQELKRFLEFVEQTAPYDIVLDALNISFVAANRKIDKVATLTFVLEHFKQQNKRILIVGRKHMLKWPKMKYLLNKTCNFLTDNVSQDDPYFITAAILSGSHTDFVSKDLLRGHRFNLQDEQLRHIFQRWQWQHQWMVFMSRSGVPIIQPPLPVTPCAQKKDSVWHLPFDREDYTGHGLMRDGTPDWASWLCLQPEIPNK